MEIIREIERIIEISSVEIYTMLVEKHDLPSAQNIVFIDDNDLTFDTIKLRVRERTEQEISS